MSNTSFVTTNTRLPHYLPFPAFLLDMKLSPTAKIIYAMLLDRTTLSQKNGWVDEGGNVYVVYPIAKLADASGNSATTIKHALNELSDLGLIERRRSGFNMPNRIFTKLPSAGLKTTSHRDRNPALTRTGNSPLATECNNMNNHLYRMGKPGMAYRLPDYSFVEGESL